MIKEVKKNFEIDFINRIFMTFDVGILVEV